ncbi:MCE family protein [Alphaproteobacteria bacterium GH1-50]|uniref:MCE family protein n=1 Tax=Kangsaoukella pontilimi TaxID=2691042 RepID=A0A7C9MCN0_9RHOB|nr:MlaD family protein [Kangsaoukella pontilimi]MXQ09553.1 MCE family protein [Kangsaoukella pontilimi]
METRANYVLIGAFALAGFLGILGFFLWFANVQLDRQFAYYDIDFRSVAGLSDASDVRFSGLPVGQVVDVRLSPNNDGSVRVRIEVDAETPVREDSIATIEAQGVTGVSYVGISPGSPDAPLIARSSVDTNDDVPMIEAGQSVLQSLSQDAPEILAETLEVVRELRQLIGGENQRRVESILENVERSSVSFAQALDDFSAISGTVSNFAREIDRFNTTLDELTGDASGVLAAAETTLSSLDELSSDARRVLAVGAETLEQAKTTITTTDRYLTEALGPATSRLSLSVTEIETRFAELSESVSGLVETYEETGQAATARLTEARETLTAANAMIATVDTTLQSVDSVAQRLDGLIADGAEPLISELRVATSEATEVIAMIGDTAETDLPVILSEIRAAAESASATIMRVGDDLSSASGRVDDLTLSADETLNAARVTFANANETLSAINAALVTGDRALTAAETAFQGADRVLNEDIGQIIESLRSTLAELETTVGQVATEIPGVTEDLRAASRSAETAFAQIARAVDQSAPAIRDFAASALPQYGRLAAETRALIDNLDTLVEQIRRDPSRFFLDPRAPEFRR